MKRSVHWLPVLLLCVILAGAGTVFAQDAEPSTTFPDIDAKAAVLIDANSGRTLFSQNSNQPLPMASTTKIMTALLLVEHFDDDDILWVPYEARGIEGSKIYIEPGERYTARDLLYALMIESANDAAIAIAINTSGSMEEFVKLMNDRAQELGLRNTSFANPHGLDAPGHHASAYDLAVLARHAMGNERFRQAVGATEAVVADPIRNSQRALRSHNLYLVNYPYATGVKTGYTSQSGFSLVGSAERDGIALIGTILGGNSAEAVARSMAELMDWGFENFTPRVLLDSNQVLSIYRPTGESAGSDGDGTIHEAELVQGRVARPVTMLMPKNIDIDPEELQITLSGDQLAVAYSGELVDQVPFEPLPVEAVDASIGDLSIADTDRAFWSSPTWLGAAGLLAGLLMFMSRRRRRRRRYRYRGHLRGWPPR